MPFDDWLTCPKTVLPFVRESFGGKIDFDPASNMVAQKYVQAEYFGISPKTLGAAGMLPDNCIVDTLRDDVRWFGNVFCNPPYSAGNIDAFVRKGLSEWKEGNITSMIMLVNSATDTRWYHDLLQHTSAILFWRGRIKFWKIVGDVALEKWEGEKSTQAGLGKVGNSPRYLSTIFFFSHDFTGKQRFRDAFANKGTIINVRNNF